MASSWTCKHCEFLNKTDNSLGAACQLCGSTRQISSCLINKRREYIVFGYIKQYIEKLLSKDIIIPSSVMKLCESYFSIYQFVEFSMYDEDILERDIDKNRFVQTLKFKKKDEMQNLWKGFYSTNGFNEGVHVFKIKCIKSGGKASDSIAIVADINHEKAKKHWVCDSYIDTSYYSWTQGIVHKLNGGWSTHYTKMYSDWNDGDDIVIELNCNEWKVSMFINDLNTKLSDCFDIEPGKTYYLCIGLYDHKAIYQSMLDD